MRASIEKLGGWYTGIDISMNGGETTNLISMLPRIAPRSGSFDVIICSEVPEHVPDTYAAFREFARLLKPGGQIILTTPFCYPMHEEPYDYVRLTPYQIGEAARPSALQVRELKPFGNEVEVLAVLWGNLWTRRARSDSRDRGRDLVAIGMCALGNVIAIGCVKLWQDSLPRKVFSGTLSVLEKAP